MCLVFTAAFLAAHGAAAPVSTTIPFLDSLMIAAFCQSLLYLFKRLTKPALRKLVERIIVNIDEEHGGDFIEEWSTQSNLLYGDLLFALWEVVRVAAIRLIQKNYYQTCQLFSKLWASLVDFFQT